MLRYLGFFVITFQWSLVSRYFKKCKLTIEAVWLGTDQITSIWKDLTCAFWYGWRLMSCGMVLPSASSKGSVAFFCSCSYMMLFDIRSMKLKFILTLSYYLSTLEAFLLFSLLFKEPPLVKIVWEVLVLSGRYRGFSNFFRFSEFPSCYSSSS